MPAVRNARCSFLCLTTVEDGYDKSTAISGVAGVTLVRDRPVKTPMIAAVRAVAAAPRRVRTAMSENGRHEADRRHARAAPPRRERVEREESVHRLGRRGPDRPGRGGG